jgi:formate-dependent nitrite reductase membrane component NrfD
MPTRKDEELQTPSVPVTVRAEESELGAAVRDYANRVRRFKINLVAWILGAILISALWVLSEWNANGAFERFAHEGNRGDWNPTLWALAVGVWGLVVGIMALRVHFERPVTTAEVDRALEQLEPRLAARYAATAAEIRRFVRRRLEGVRRLKFHVAAWVLAMVVITPLNALIEWQDNGAFERLSGNSQPGSWDPWVLYIGGIWALVIAALALVVYVDRPNRIGRRNHQGGRGPSG